MNKESSDDLDRTDELPVLLESVVFGVPARPEETGEHTLEHQASSAAEPNPTFVVLEDVTERAAVLEDLERKTAELAAHSRELEEQLANKDRAIHELERAVAELRSTALDRAPVEAELVRQLADRDARIEELVASRHGLQVELDAQAADAATLKVALEEAERERDTLEARARHRQSSRDDAALEQLSEDNAALAAYIATRRDAWEATEAARTALAARVVALEQELAASTPRLQAAEGLAARESSRATGLRAELAATARRLEDAERQLKEFRDAAPPATVVAAAPETATATTPATVTTSHSPPPPPLVDESVSDEDDAAEVIAQLEAEVEYKRQQVAAQMVELRDRELRLNAITAELDAARSELAELAVLDAEHETLRATVARLERTVLDKDRALQARDARITTLQDEIKQRVVVEKLAALDVQGLDVTLTGQIKESSVEGVRAPTLICLTGDAEKRFALTKKNTMIGRGSHCDLQILTHFVSREHARVTVNGGAAVLEDLGSRNGVFVNSVRIDRHVLEHGDLVTIGETQFRFVESVAH